MLVDLSFSDLIILPDGSARLKGCPETGQQLIPVPADCTDEIKDLPNRLTDAVLSRRHMDPATGMRVESGTIRFHHQGIHYRVADIQDVNSGRTWFLRRLAERVPDLTGLGLPPYLCEWLLLEDQRQGLVLVAGAQASGKTTTASALVAGRLMRHGGHGVTFENPAELPLGGSWGSTATVSRPRSKASTNCPSKSSAPTATPLRISFLLEKSSPSMQRWKPCAWLSAPNNNWWSLRSTGLMSSRHWSGLSIGRKNLMVIMLAKIWPTHFWLSFFKTSKVSPNGRRFPNTCFSLSWLRTRKVPCG